ncbi:MAG: hypothetical protein ACP5NF_01105 [Thermoanaerobaculum sp.]
MGDLVHAWREGELADELEILRALRSPYCPAALVEAVAGSSLATSRRRITLALVRHPHCPRAFVLRALPLLGWHDLLTVVEDPRAPMPVRLQAQSKLLERLPALTVGEKIALARRAPPHVFSGLFGESDTRIVAALLENPKFSQGHCLRLAAETSSPRVLAEILRHDRWGQTTSVLKAALANPALPVALTVAVLVSLSDDELSWLSQCGDFPQGVRRLASKALWVRGLRGPGDDRYLH